MRLVFAGTPDFAVPALDALHAAGHVIVGVFTQPDRPAGRGRKLQASPVALCAEALGLAVHKPPKLHAEAQAVLRELAPEVMVVVAYGLLLPQAVLDIPPRGCLNIHGSLLPRWRGAAPIARAVEAGDSETGITIMRMDAGLDTGPMLLLERLPLTPEMTAAQLHDALSPLGGRLIVEALARLQRGELPEQAQPAEGMTYAKKLSKEEARVDWSQPAATLARRVRAFNPAPVAWSELDGERIRFWNARGVDAVDSALPGTVIATDAAGLRIACGEGALLVTELQRPGGKALEAGQAVRGWAIAGKTFT
ncbi:MAG: methionyl-tRNA formyltransferase [Nevskia sp.]|nr:methionyl-tRNA formyltransferase [Nevskia sp.]